VLATLHGIAELDESPDGTHRELRQHRRLALAERAIGVRPAARGLHRRAVAQPDDEVALAFAQHLVPLSFEGVMPPGHRDLAWRISKGVLSL